MTPGMRLALAALWFLSKNSRCWSSRQVALRALMAIRAADDMEGDEYGLPDKIVLADHEKPVDDNYLKMWG